MLRASLRGLLSRKLRLALAVVAVMLGTGFLSGAFVFSDTMSSRFTQLFESVNQDIDVQVQLTADAAKQVPPPRLTQAQLDAVRGVPGVAAASGDVSSMNVIPFHVATGKPVRAAGGAPQFGAGIRADDPFRLLELAEGQWPAGAGQVALSRFTADRAGAKLGDRIKVYLPRLNGPQVFSVVGIARYTGDRASLAGETMVLFERAEAQRLFYGAEGLYSGVNVQGKDGVSQAQLRSRVAAVVPAGFVAKTGEQATKDQANGPQTVLSALVTYVLVPFGVVGVLVGIFLIFNTFNIVVAQRARELALYRAMGASWGQICGSVLVEAVLVGFLGSTLGLLAGIGVGAAAVAGIVSLTGVQLPGSGVTVTAVPVALAYLVGVVVTVVSAFIPAIKASMVPPLAAMREIARPDRPLRVIGIVGGAFAVPGAALVGAALTGLGSATMPLLAVGVVLTFIGVALLSPLLARPVAGLIGRAVGWGVSGKLGVRNALRNPRRTAVTAAALMIGVTLVTTVSVLGESFKRSVTDEITSTIGADIVIQTEANGPPNGTAGFAPAALDQVRAIPGVRQAEELYVTVDATVDGKRTDGVGTAVGAVDDLDAARTMFSMKAAAGQLRTLADEEFVADADTAKTFHWNVGSTAHIKLSQGGERTYRLIGTMQTTPIWRGLVLLPRSAVKDFAGPLANAGYVKLDAGADTKAITQQIEQIMSDYPLVTVGDLSALLAQYNQFVNVAVMIIWALLLVAIAVALLGILNTLLLSIYERTRELGMLRAVGLSRRSVVRMIGTESVIMAVFGCVLGVALGLALGSAVSAALIDRNVISLLAIPWGSVIAFVIVAIIAGVFAAVVPAWRAARLNVLAAIAYE